MTTAGCLPSADHTELPMSDSSRLVLDQPRTRVRVLVEKRWSTESEHRGDQRNDYLNVNATVRWIRLGEHAKPSVVELQGQGPRAAAPSAVAVFPNVDTWASTSTQFDFEQCQPRCTFDLELSWHHADSGELEVDWSVQATRTVWRRGARRSQTWNFHVVAVEPLAIAIRPDARE